MANATSQPSTQSEANMGIPYLCVRLEEPFERIVTNNPGLKIEQNANGEVVFMTPTGGESGRRNSNLSFQLELWASNHGGFCFDSSTLFQLPNGAKRSPDASWIAPERWKQLSQEDREGYPPICPDFVVELRSKTDRLQDLQEKMEEYIANGVRLGWLIDPLHRVVHVYRTDNASVCLREVTQVGDDELLPGFVLDLTNIWSDSV